MVTREQVEAMVDRYISEVGLTKQDTYNPERRAWYWVKGSAKIEVFVQEIKMETHSRYFLRVFSPIVKLPATNLEAFYRRLLELNDTRLGVKLTVMPGSDQVYATYERDIRGIDYDELSMTIADLEWWADELDDALAQQFAGEPPVR